jgi:hypothetical protein
MAITTYPDNINPAAFSIISQHFLPSLDSSEVTTILEFGCSTGALGEAIIRIHPALKWIGIDYSHNALSVAEKRLTQVHQADLNNVTIAYLLRLELSPSILVMVDVLEHVHDPWTFMQIVKKAFPCSMVLCVLPNISCYQTYDRLSQHEFSYEEFGIFDKTHKTFYTAKSALRFFDTFDYTKRIGPLFLPDPMVSNLLSERIDYPYTFRRGRYSIEIVGRDELISLCSYGFGFLFEPS